MSTVNPMSQTSAQGYLDDPRNEDVLVYINGEFFPRDRATVSVFDAGFALGDGVWEGLRVVRGRIIALDEQIRAGRGRQDDARPQPDDRQRSRSPDDHKGPEEDRQSGSALRHRPRDRRNRGGIQGA